MKILRDGKEVEVEDGYELKEGEEEVKDDGNGDGDDGDGEEKKLDKILDKKIEKLIDDLSKRKKATPFYSKKDTKEDKKGDK